MRLQFGKVSVSGGFDAFHVICWSADLCGFENALFAVIGYVASSGDSSAGTILTFAFETHFVFAWVIALFDLDCDVDGLCFCVVFLRLFLRMRRTLSILSASLAPWRSWQNAPET